MGIDKQMDKTEQLCKASGTQSEN